MAIWIGTIGQDMAKAKARTAKSTSTSPQTNECVGGTRNASTTVWHYDKPTHRHTQTHTHIGPILRKHTPLNILSHFAFVAVCGMCGSACACACVCSCVCDRLWTQHPTAGRWRKQFRNLITFYFSFFEFLRRWLSFVCSHTRWPLRHSCTSRISVQYGGARALSLYGVALRRCHQWIRSHRCVNGACSVCNFVFRLYYLICNMGRRCSNDEHCQRAISMHSADPQQRVNRNVNRNARHAAPILCDQSREETNTEYIYAEKWIHMGIIKRN